MDAASFYKTIFPPTGIRVLAVFKGGLSQPPTHLFFETDDELIEAAQSWDFAGRNVYHACATFKTTENRKGSNAESAKSLWLDLDVGEKKPYKNIQSAVTSVARFVKTTGLPNPHYVTSGRGLHVYWPLEQAISVEDWAKLANRLASCLSHCGVEHDSSRTQDIASILRVPGTKNYKDNPASAVAILREGIVSPARVIYDALEAYAAKNGILVLDKANTNKTNDLVGERDYPPSYASNIITRCGVLAEVDSTGGDVPYEIWWRAIGLSKSLVSAAEVAAHWTRSRSVTGHNKYDWQRIHDEWSAGPTTCEGFSQHSAKCASCPSFGKIKSPIQLGVSERPEVIDEQESAPEEQPVRNNTSPLEFMDNRVMQMLSSKARVGVAKNVMSFRYVNEDGTVESKEFSNRYWQAMNRILAVDGTWKVEIAYRIYEDQEPKTFLLDSAAITNSELLRKEFSARELHIYGGPAGMAKSQEVLRLTQDLLNSLRQETVEYPTFGWVTVDHQPRGPLTGDFVLGNRIFRPNEKPSEVLLSKSIPDKLGAGFERKGTIVGWTDVINKVYNRRGAEPYQFLISSVFAAPLVRLISGGSWHGIPIALCGDSGAAKTTTAMAAMTVYGNPEAFKFNMQQGAGDTINAFQRKVGVLNHLPFIADEMSNHSAETLASVMYMLANGEPKDRMTMGGEKLQTNPYRWDTLSVVTSNDSMHEQLKKLSEHIGDATQLRCFEIKLSRDDLHKVFHDVNASTIDEDLLKNQYGAVGFAWIQFLVNNRLKIVKLLEETRRNFKIDASDNSDIRFYKDLLMTVEVAAKLAQRCGYFEWDVDNMIRWAKSTLVGLRETVRMKDWESTISDLIASYYGRTIVTKHLPQGRGRPAASAMEMPMETLSHNEPPCARRAIEDKVFYVTAASVNEWAKKNNVLPANLIHEMLVRGVIKAQASPTMGTKGSYTRAVSIGSGTNIPRPQAPCYELDYDKVFPKNMYGDGTADTSNVVSFPTAVAVDQTQGNVSENS